MFIRKHVHTEESGDSNEAGVENTLNFNWVSWCTFGAFRQERNSLDLGGTETGPDQLEFLRLSDEMTERVGRIVWRVHNTSLYRAAPKNGKQFSTRSALQICCLISSNKCCMDAFPTVRGLICSIKEHRLPKETSLTRKVPVTTYQGSESESKQRR